MITLKQIRDNKYQKPCEDSWSRLLKSCGKTKADDTVVTCEYLLDTLGIDDTMWVISNCIHGKKVKKRHMVADIAGRVLHIWEDWAKDHKPKHLDAPRKAVDAVRNGKVNDEILRGVDAAWEAAWDAAYAASRTADYAASRALDAADAARAASYATHNSDAAWAANAAAEADAGAGYDAERVEQKKIILTYFGE